MMLLKNTKGISLKSSIITSNQHLSTLRRISTQSTCFSSAIDSGKYPVPEIPGKIPSYKTKLHSTTSTSPLTRSPSRLLSSTSSTTQSHFSPASSTDSYVIYDLPSISPSPLKLKELEDNDVLAEKMPSLNSTITIEEVFSKLNFEFPVLHSNIFPIGISLKYNMKSRNQGHNVEFTKEALDYLMQEDLKVRRFLAFIHESNVSQVEGVRIALIGSSKTILTEPWNARRGLISTKYRSKDEYLIQVPFKAAITAPNIPLISYILPSSAQDSVTPALLWSSVMNNHVSQFNNSNMSTVELISFASLIAHANAAEDKKYFNSKSQHILHSNYYNHNNNPHLINTSPPPPMSTESVATYVNSLGPYSQMFPSYSLNKDAFSSLPSPPHLNKLHNVSRDIAFAYTQKLQSPGELLMQQPHLPVIDILQPFRTNWLLDGVSPDKVLKGEVVKTCLYYMSSTSPETNQTWEQFLNQKSEKKQNFLTNEAENYQKMETQNRRSLMYTDKQVENNMIGLFYHNIPPLFPSLYNDLQALKSKGNNIDSIKLFQTGGVKANSTKERSMEFVNSTSLVTAESRATATSVDEQPLFYSILSRVMNQVACRTLQVPTPMIPFTTSINAIEGTVTTHDVNGDSEIGNKQTTHPTGIHRSLTSTQMLVPYIDMMNHALTSDQHNSAVVFSQDEDEQGQLATYINIVGRKCIMPHDELFLAYHKLDDLGESENVDRGAWNGLSDSTNTDSNPIEENSTKQPWVQLKTSELLYTYGIPYVDEATAEITLSLQSLIQRMNSIKKSALKWNAEYKHYDPLPIQHKYGFNDVAGWRRINTNLDFTPTPDFDTMSMLKMKHQHYLNQNLNTHMSISVQDTALHHLMSSGNNIAHKSLNLVGKNCNRTLEFQRLLEYSHKITSQLLPQLHQNDIDYFYHPSTPNRELKFTVLKDLIHNFTACCLLLDVGQAVWGVSIPSVNINIITSLRPSILFDDVSLYDDILLSALPNNRNFMNLLKNKHTDDKNLLNTYHKNVRNVLNAVYSECGRDLKKNASSQPIVEQCYESLARLDSMKAVVDIRASETTIFQETYFIMFQQFLRSVEEYKKV